jgi:23S rRNA (adenine2503-C2)-methyltransferase
VNQKIPLLSQTKDQFAQFIYQQLGKGYDHASLVYEEWFRTGQILGQHPAFKNAQYLLDEILNLTDLTLLPFKDKREEGQTGKFLLLTPDHLEVESVLIPMQAGGTLCVSSQVGCRMGCAFCETGRMGLFRNLTAAEIINQVFIARFHLKFPIRNIVFMGMGEPFDNYDHVMQAVRVLSDPHGLGFGRNHLTISTSGCVDGILKLIEEPEPVPNLAVSINAPNDELRHKLMPVNRKYPLKTLYEAMEIFCKKRGRQILIAYVLIKDQNDSLEHATELAHYLKGLSVKINLIPYNPQSHDRYQPPEPEKLEAFMQHLRHLGYYTLLRQTKGRKIMAACGQLGNLRLRQQKKTTKSFK